MEKSQEQIQVESFLDFGWSVIGRMHRWLSICQPGNCEQSELIDVIRGLQSLWSSSEDLGLTRIAYSCLTLEQVLERFCAGTLEIKTKHLIDITAGVEFLQNLLLGFEAMREEPTDGNLDVMLRLYQYATEPSCVKNEPKLPALRKIAVTSPIPPEATDLTEISIPIIAPVVEKAVATTESAAVVRDVESHPVLNQISAESTVLAMLEEFVNKLDATCHHLHERMVADETPYVTTTTRLEHLVQVTQELVLQLGKNTSSIPVPALDDSLPNCPLFDEFALDDTVLCDRTVMEVEILDSPTEQDIQDLKANSTPIRQPGVAELNASFQRILIVDESLFYRQMISTALRNMGYDPQVVDSAKTGIELLKQSQDYCAVLVNATISPAMSEVLQTCRRDHGVKVIGMVSSKSDDCLTSEFDDQVVRSNPSHLREILNGVLNARVTSGIA